MLSERFAEPLGLLAEGTRAVAQGDFTRRQPVTSRDELGVLTESFNAMTASSPTRMRGTRSRAARSRRRARTSRASSATCRPACSRSTIEYRLRTANPSASVILQQPLADLTGVPLPDWGRRLPALAPFAELVAEGFRGSARRASGSARRRSASRTCRARC